LAIKVFGTANALKQAMQDTSKKTLIDTVGGGSSKIMCPRISETKEKVAVMQSTNFEFLRKNADWQPLADLGGFAENYTQPDPVAAVVKLRSFAEVMVGWIYDALKLPKPFRATFNDLLVNDAFQAVAPRVVLAKLHAVRKEGNRAAHGETIDGQTALWLLKESFDLGCWLYLSYGGGSKSDLPTYTEPPKDTAVAITPAMKRAYLEKIATQEAQMQQLLSELEATRAKARETEGTVAELKAQQQALVAGTQAADVLSFDEASTRRLIIDAMLGEAGWNVGKKKANTGEVRQELEVPHQPTTSEKGYADYVLFGEDGKPLAVVEAKKTAIDPEAGRTQAKIYADGLEKQYSVRPFIYYTNGYDIWFWNDAAKEPPRKVYGFHSKDSLQYRRFQLAEREPRSKVAPSGEIVTRLYQFEAIKKIVERFTEKKRKALLVQATGTGKTRVAVALSDALIRAKWARRILFLCDRRELRKQAGNAYKEFLPAEPRVNVSSETSQDRDKRIYLSTYPAMMKCFQTFDVGFFDLIIADESHRSIYNRYRDIFEYFDAYQVGLTATPVKFVLRDTYKIFGCEIEDPTFSYDYREAVEQGYLCPFEVETHTTAFLRDGIKYSQMTPEQREQVEAEGGDPTLVEHDPEQVDRVVFNKDTNRLILRNLMEHGIRDASDTRVGKTIIFARNHNHAVLLQNLFETELYPQYGGTFCRIIDNYDPRAEELIDEFKDPKSDLTIAISVDMLDTGIDVPEVVNLVFAKPVYSYAKFWQMIGRGTRLRPNLFGPGKDKTRFLIFDHWGNFERFDENYNEAQPATSKSLMQHVFEARIRLAEAALTAQDLDAFKLAIGQITKDIAALPEKSIAVREKWKEVKTIGRPEVLQQFAEATKAALKNQIAPLMQWVPIGDHEDAYRFDRLICQLQAEHLRGSSKFDDVKGDVLNDISQLRINLTQVAVKAPIINQLKSKEFWANVSVTALEQIRTELRDVMKYRLKPTGTSMPPRVLDIKEEDSLVERKKFIPKLEGLELVAYRNRVLKVLTDLFEQNETLKKIKAGEPVSETDLQALNSLVLTQDASLDLTDLLEYYPETAGHLDRAIRAIIGMDAETVRTRFTQFVTKHPELSSHQVKFLDLLQNHLGKYGAIEIADLYEPPFTFIHSDGLDGVFDEPLAEELLSVIGSFSSKNNSEQSN
jgi:type I restriction enzyme R subunit